MTTKSREQWDRHDKLLRRLFDAADKIAGPRKNWLGRLVADGGRAALLGMRWQAWRDRQP